MCLGPKKITRLVTVVVSAVWVWWWRWHYNVMWVHAIIVIIGWTRCQGT